MMMRRVLIAKTGLDGHWIGVSIVARALRDAGFEVILLGMADAQEIATAVANEDPDLVGLNIGGHINVAVRAVQAIRAQAPEIPIFAGGTISPTAAARLLEFHVPVFPPGSSLADIVATANQLIVESSPAPSQAPG
jgi:methylmalonyl-CoA mutase C-terminal domain/subunit